MCLIVETLFLRLKASLFFSAKRMQYPSGPKKKVSGKSFCETLCISSQCSEQWRQKSKTDGIWPYTLSILVSINNSHFQIQTELFSSRHADSRHTDSMFAKQQPRIANIRTFQNNIKNTREHPQCIKKLAIIIIGI